MVTKLFTQDQLAILATRTQPASPYYSGGAGFTNSPNDGQRLKADADTFLAQPLWSGTGGGEPLFASVWTGYLSGRPDTNSQYAQQHLRFALASAIYGIANPSADANYRLKPKSALLAQIAVSQQTSPASRTTFFPNWSDATDRTKGGITGEIRAAGVASGNSADANYTIPVYAGTPDCGWMSVFCEIYNLVRDLCNSSEQYSIESYIAAQAMWIAQREATYPLWFTSLYPNWLSGDFSVKGYYAADGTLPGYLGDPFQLANPKNSREAVWASQPDTAGFLYTHRNSDGTLGYKIAKAHYYCNNQSSLRMQFVALASAVLPTTNPNKDYLYNIALRYGQLFLVNGVFPNGDTIESFRNGDYGITGQGMVAYGAHNLQFLLLLCHVGKMRGDSTMLTWSTSLGCRTSAGGPKSIKKVFDRHIDVLTGVSSCYFGSVSPTNLISEFAPQRTFNGQSFRAAYLPFRYLLFWANQFWPTARYVNFAKGSIAGQQPIPSPVYVGGVLQNEIRNNGPVPNPWRGAYCDWAPCHMLYADVSAPSYPSPFALSGGGIYTNKIAVQLQATGGISYTWSRVSGTSTWTITNTTGPITSIQGTNGRPLPARTYRVRCVARLADGTTESKTVDVTIT